MSYYEYRVVPAVKEAPRARGVKGTDARFALAMQEALNAEGLDGWEFQRAETLTVEDKRGLLRKSTTSSVTVLIYRRWVDTDGEQITPETAMDWHPPAPRQEPDTPETLGAQIARENDSAPASGRGLTASRRPGGDLRPVPGAGRS